MRDDIHNKAPISPSLRGVLRQALRPADQQRPDRLADRAVKAMVQEFNRNFSADFLKGLQRDVTKPGLFGRGAFAPASCSRMEADVLDYFTHNPQATVQQALAVGAHAYIDSLCNESEAAMIAAGGRRSEVRTGVQAFRIALRSAAEPAAEACITGSKPQISDHKVTLTETLPLGKRALRGKK